MKPVTVMTIFGTRPEAIKMAPLALELSRRENIRALCCVTAQHREMLDSVLEIFHLKPDYDLNIMEPRQTLSTITSKCLLGMDGVLDEARPDLVLVHGDTSTTFAGALSAFYHQIPVGHVEAGLRTYDKWSPFPEEMNRKMVGAIADLHFCPTVANRDNLARENIKTGVFLTGNTVIDALQTTVKERFTFQEEVLNRLDYQSRRVILVTCHRRENYGQPMTNIMTALRRLADASLRTGAAGIWCYRCMRLEAEPDAAVFDAAYTAELRTALRRMGADESRIGARLMPLDLKRPQWAPADFLDHGMALDNGAAYYLIHSEPPCQPS